MAVYFEYREHPVYIPCSLLVCWWYIKTVPFMPVCLVFAPIRALRRKKKLEKMIVNQDFSETERITFCKYYEFS